MRSLNTSMTSMRFMRSLIRLGAFAIEVAKI